MEPADGRVILFIIIGIALFVLGRRFQFMVMMWKAWKDTVAAVPVRKQVAFTALRTLLKVGVVAAFVFWLATNLNRFI